MNRCPQLWHVAPEGAWAQIETAGLRTAAQLIDLADIADDTRALLRTGVRHDKAELVVEEKRVVLRDQARLLRRKDLEGILGDGLTTADWVQMLNRRVYLFASEGPMLILRDKYVRLDGAQDVLTLSPLRLLEHAAGRIELARQNTGAIARRTGVQKDRGTFVPLSRFPDDKPTEVTVLDGIRDPSVVTNATRYFVDGRKERLWPRRV